jgi:hypothetical protein
MAIGWLAFVVKMWRLGEPGLALLPLSYVLHVSLQLVLLPHIRAKRGPWRELCYLTSCMHMVVTNLVLDLRSGVTILPLHGGSALRLAAVLAVANCSLIQAFLWPMSGFPLPFVALALPLVLPLPLASSRQICLRLLEDGAAAEPLATLHSAIGAAHSPFGGPYAWQLFDWTNASAGASHQLRQCLEVNVYLLLMVGGALPLLYAWRARSRQQQLQAPQRMSAADTTAAVLPWQQSHPLPCLVLASCAAWCCSGVAGLALRS